MISVAVLDDWQDIARDSADWSALSARAEVTLFRPAFNRQRFGRGWSVLCLDLPKVTDCGKT